MAEPTDWEIASSIANMVTALAAIGMLCIAWKGLDTWRKEFIGRRKAEIAEDALAAIYKSVDVIKWVRYPVSLGNEGKSRKAEDDESSEEKLRRDLAFVPIERLNKHSGFFAKMQSSRYRVKALFGPEAGKLIDEIRIIRGEIVIAAEGLYDITEDNKDITISPNNDIAEEIKQHKRTIRGHGGANDPIQPKLDELVSDAESVFSPSINLESAS